MEKSNYVAAYVLKNQVSALPNRGADGHAKTIIWNGTRRAKISSQCIKRAMREEDDFRTLRSGHFEDLVEKTLIDAMNAGLFSQDEKLTQKPTDKDEKTVFDELGKEICGFIGADWNKRSSIEKSSKKAKKDDEDKQEKGRTMICCSPYEIRAIVNYVLDNYKEMGKDAYFAKNPKTKEKEIKNELDNLTTPEDVALYGRMTTNSLIETEEGACRFSNAYSVDEYNNDIDDWVAKEDGGKYPEENSDPFFSRVNEFVKEQGSKAAATGMGTSDEYSNLMYYTMNINIDSLVESLSRGYEIDKKKSKEHAIEVINKQIEKFAFCSPSGKEHSCFSNYLPTLIYIEIIKNGKPISLGFEKAISKKDDESVSEQAILKISRNVSDAMRRDEVSKFVIIENEYKYLADEFKKVGVTPVDSFDELAGFVSENISNMEI